MSLIPMCFNKVSRDFSKSLVKLKLTVMLISWFGEHETGKIALQWVSNYVYVQNDGSEEYLVPFVSYFISCSLDHSFPAWCVHLVI